MTDLSNNKLGRKVLGRGLGALLPETENNTQLENSEQGSVYLCDIDKIETNTKQPRKEFRDEYIEELANSIRENGILQPLLVRKKSNGNFELVAGERRLRAAKLVGLESVPVVVKELTDRQVLQAALVENIQRQDLNAIEEAEAYRSLLEEYNMTQEDLAKAVGKNRSSIANYLRLLKLPADIRTALSREKISMGHARALCSLDTADKQREVFKKILENTLSVRETEALIKNIHTKQEVRKEKPERKTRTLSPIEKSLQDVLKTRIRINGTETKGKFVIDYYSKSDFDRILSLLYGEYNE